MKVLLLTNQHHIDFIVGYLPDFLPDGVDLSVKYTGEYDWSEDYDIGVSFMYQYKVPAKEVNSHTWFNFHPGPLPEYKGRNLCYHAIMNCEANFGATIHYMDESFDTGDIIEVLKFPILAHYTAQDVHDSAMFSSRALFRKYFPRIIAGENFPRYPHSGGWYYKKEPINEFLDMDNCISERDIRAITYGDFYPKIDIGGVTYKIVRDE